MQELVRDDPLGLIGRRLDVYHDSLMNPVTLPQSWTISQNPNLPQPNIGLRLLKDDTTGVMEDMRRRFRNVPEFDPAAVARRTARERNKQTRQPFIPSWKMAYKTAESFKPRISSQTKSHPRFVDIELEIPFIPLGREKNMPIIPVLFKNTPAILQTSTKASDAKQESDEAIPSAQSESIEEDAIESKSTCTKGLAENSFVKLNIDRACCFPNPKSGMPDVIFWRRSEGEVLSDY